MSYGLRVWDASGNLKVDVSNRLTRFVSSIYISFGSGQGDAGYDTKYINFPGMADNGSWFVSSNSGWIIPKITTNILVVELHPLPNYWREGSYAGYVTVFRV